MGRPMGDHHFIFRQGPAEDVGELGALRHQETAARNTPALACCSSLCTATKRIVSRWAASQIASVSAMSLFWRLTKGFTYAAGLSRTSCPILLISRTQ